MFMALRLPFGTLSLPHVSSVAMERVRPHEHRPDDPAAGHGDDAAQPTLLRRDVQFGMRNLEALPSQYSTGALGVTRGCVSY
jgi:hypothetical protein